MEIAVELLRARERLALRAAQPLERLPRAPLQLLRRARGGEADVGAVEEQAEFVKLVGARAQQHHVEQQRAQNLRPDGAAQVRPAPLRGLDDAQHLQHLHRLAYARLADAVALRELALRGQRLAGAELAVPYRLLYAFEYEL